MFCDTGCPCAKEQGLPGGWEDWAEPSHPSGCTWCEVAAHPASLLPLGWPLFGLSACLAAGGAGEALSLGLGPLFRGRGVVP